LEKNSTDFGEWESLQQGDSNIFRVVYQKNIRMLLGYGYKLTTDRELVEDCLQDMFVHLWENRDKIVITKSIRSYLMVTFRRRIYLKLKESVKFKNNYELEESNILILDSSDYDRTETRDSLRKAVKLLTERQQEVIYLKFTLDFKNVDIADAMGLSIESVYNLTSQAVKSLKREYQNILNSE
jgi:RNA polymerase sigma factor (sigma-70 family)